MLHGINFLARHKGSDSVLFHLDRLPKLINSWLTVVCAICSSRWHRIKSPHSSRSLGLSVNFTLTRVFAASIRGKWLVPTFTIVRSHWREWEHSQKSLARMFAYTRAVNEVLEHSRE